MQDIEYLKTKGGLDEESLKAKFAPAKEGQVSEKIQSLLDLHRDRINSGVEKALRDAPFYKAVDDAVAAARKNLPSIMARELAMSGKSEDEIVKSFKAFHLENMLTPMIDLESGNAKCGSDGKPIMCFNKPIFEDIFIPLVANYRNIRLAKLFNDRNLFPRYKYSPARLTAKDMVAADIITHRVARMTADMGYAEEDRQAMRQALDYGWSISFPQEVYYVEKYTTEVDGKTEERVAREGVRSITPHPTRCIVDQNYPLHTVNTDTGVEYMGYWDIKRWRDIGYNEMYWNRDKVTFGDVGDFSKLNGWSAYQEIYPCNIKFPVIDGTTNGLGAGSQDRLNNAYVNNRANDDKAVTVIVLFHKLTPKDWDISDYDKPVWMRFVYSNTNTIIYAEPVAYTPGYVMLYDYDANLSLNSSLSLELTPFQQLLGNFLVQHFVAVKKNLLRLAFANTDLLTEQHIREIENDGDKMYQKGIKLLRFSKRSDVAVLGDRKSESLIPLASPIIPTSETAAEIQMLLGVVERMLGYTAQEVGAPAAHEQTAAEVNIVAANSSVRLEYIGTGIDSGINAKKRMLYEAMYCYGSDEVLAEVADMTPERQKALKDLGFDVEDDEKPGALKAVVRGKKSALKLESFVSEREGINRLNDSKIGVAMMQMLSVAMQQPVLFQQIGPTQFLTLLNYVLRMMGLPEDFRLKPAAPDGQAAGGMPNPEEIRQAFVEALKNAEQQIVAKAVEVVAQQVKQGVADPMAQEIQQVGQVLQQFAAKDQQLEQAVVQLGQQTGAGLQQLSQQDQVLQAAIQQLTAAMQQLGMEHAAITNAAATNAGPGSPIGAGPMA